MFRALLAHPQEVLSQAVLGILCAYYVSWLLMQQTQRKFETKTTITFHGMVGCSQLEEVK
jgi:hypothetical protein